MPDDTTLYSVVASDEWTELAFDTHLNLNVTDVLSVNGAMYFACGDDIEMERVYAYNKQGCGRMTTRPTPAELKRITWQCNRGRHQCQVHLADHV